MGITLNNSANKLISIDMKNVNMSTNIYLNVS